MDRNHDSINLATSAPSLKNMNTVRTQNSYKITGGMCNDMIQVKDNDAFKGNGSLLMGSFENFETNIQEQKNELSSGNRQKISDNQQYNFNRNLLENSFRNKSSTVYTKKNSKNLFAIADDFFLKNESQTN